jgi:hypothetical protein
MIATDAFNLYKNATGGVLDDQSGLLTINSTQFNKLQDLSFTIPGVCI